MRRVFRLLKVVSCPIGVPVGVIFHHDPDLRAALAGATGPIVFGLTGVFVAAHVVTDARRRAAHPHGD